MEGPLQKQSKGTGLGLPLSRKLADLLGGGVSVRSEPGSATVRGRDPRSYRGPDEAEATPESRWRLDPFRSPVLVVEEDPVDQLLYEKHLEGSGFQVLRPGPSARHAGSCDGSARWQCPGHPP